MHIPDWLKAHLKPEEADRIVETIRVAESTTSSELVPMIVRCSSTIGHVPMLLLTLLVVLFFATGGPAWQVVAVGEHWVWYLVDIALLIVATAACARWPFVQRLLTTRADQAFQVDARAVIEFYESKINHTKHATGVLILVSLMERRAVVLADEGINEKVPKETWQEVCDQLVKGIKKKRLGEAMCEALLKCAQIMTPHFPIQPDDENELRNQLIIKE